jgi:hypothetical protein
METTGSELLLPVFQKEKYEKTECGAQRDICISPVCAGNAIYTGVSR